MVEEKGGWLVHLVCTDLDGTLLGADARISQESAALLRPMLDEGLPLAVATARSPATVVELLRPLGLRTPAVLMTGTMIYDVAHTRCLAATPLARETAAAVCAVLERTGQEALAYSVKGGHLYVYYKEFACDFERSFVSSRIHSP
ncbi:MAG: HAD family hydrolase, partial [Ruthenibacterium lactatiformans]